VRERFVSRRRRLLKQYYNTVIPGMSANLHWKRDERFIAPTATPNTARDTQQLTHVYHNDNTMYRYNFFLCAVNITKGIFVLWTLAVHTDLSNIFLHLYIERRNPLGADLYSFRSYCFRHLKNLPVALTYSIYTITIYTFCTRTR